MDDFVISNLRESKDEWCCYLVDILSPLIKQGVQSMFQQAWTMCVDKGETDKYLMTFQNLLTLISKWNSITIEEERKRIVEQSGCHYLEELIVCVHIIHLKVMTHIRVGNRQKKIDISLPKLDDFIHKVYIHCARQIYKNVYLFERNVEPLVQQKYNRELELMIQQAILTSVRDSIPKEQIIRSFLDENTELEEEIIIEPLAAIAAPTPTPVETPSIPVEETPKILDLPPVIVPSIQDLNTDAVVTQIKFNEFNDVLKPDGNIEKELAPPLPSTTTPSTSTDSSQNINDIFSHTSSSDINLSLNDLGITDLSPPVDLPSTDLSSVLDIKEI